MNREIPNDLVTILKEAEAFGFDKRERHEVAWRYHCALKEFDRLQQRPNGLVDGSVYFKYRDDREYHCAVKARAYMARHVDEIQKKNYTRQE